ncbi:sensor histidine kinase [Thioalkalivibrio sulfidiphilus]|uniref:sensor histidine kinase n=1 Tax=Thioalkalivibrio sulfidiphilus TaxID=1033854 RepID=UPI003B336F36
MRSLKVRITLLVGISLLLLLAAQAVGLRIIPGALVQDYVVTRLEHDADTLYGRLVDGTEPVELFSRTVGLIYETPLSGHYFRIMSGDTVLRSRSLWDTDLTLEPVPPGEQRISRAPGPAGQSLLIYSRGYRVQGEPVTIAVAEDLSAMESTVARLERSLLTVMLLGVGLVLLIQYLIVQRALRPVDAAVQACRRLEAGGAAPMQVQAPREIEPLVEAVNRLIRHHGLRLERTRRALGNVSHALKTPLAVMSQIIDELAERGDRASADALRAQLQAIRNTVERELHRARLAGRDHPGAGFDARAELEPLVDALRRLYGERVSIALDIEGEPAAVDSEDMLELFGNLLDNACKWARSRVRVRLRQGAGVEAEIEDDGPGVEEDKLARLGQPGMRLDESTPGHGLGLSIVHDVVSQYGGEIRYGRSTELHGLRVQVRIPG